MTTLLLGVLVVEDGCLRIEDSNSDTSYLPVWPPRFVMSIEADSVLLLNPEDQAIAEVGQEVRVSGGEVRSAQLLDENLL